MSNEPMTNSKKINFDRPRAALLRVQERIATSPSSYLAYCFLVPMAIMFLIYLAMELHPFGDGSVLVLDLNGQYVYFFEALRNTVWGEGSLLYSFFRALGGEFMGMYAYYLASPLSYIVAIFPQDRILEALLTIILLKVGLCGFSFGFYLHKSAAHPNKVVSVAFSVMYALCAYAVVHQNNIMWIDALIWLPLLTLGIEQLILNRRYKLFVVSLAMTIMSNYYIGYMVCIYTVLYFFYYYFAHSKDELNPRGETLYFVRTATRFGFFALLAAAISAFVILGAYYSLTFGKNDFSNPSWALEPKFQFLDFFTKFLPGSYDTVRPEGLPFVYCGVLPLMLVPVYFLSRKINTREKVASLLLICVFILSFIVNPLDLIWHGFQTPNWLNYRYSFMLCFFLLTLAYKGMGNLRAVGERFLFGITALIVLFVTVCDKLEFETYVESNKKLLTLETVWLTILATVALFTVLCMLIRQKHPRKREGLAGILAAVVCLEIFCSGLACVVQFDNDVVYSSYSGYNNFIGDLRPITERVKEQDDGFYRMEKLVHRKFNDNMALAMRGLSNSTSTLNSDTITFLHYMGYASRSHLSQYLGGNPVNDSLLGIKYLIDKKESDKLTHTYEELLSDENYAAYKNPYALSVAYGVDGQIKDFDMTDYGSSFERMNAMVSAMLGEDSPTELFRPVTDYDTAISQYCAKRTMGTQTTYSIAMDGGEATVTYTFVAPTDAEYYFFPFNRTRNEARLSVNDEVLFNYYLGSNNTHLAPIGHFSEGETVTVTLTLLEEDVTLYNYFDYIWYLDDSTFQDAFARLRSNPQFVVEQTTEDRLTGRIETTKDGQMIQTTIPYDKGWKVFVDGVEIETYETMNALLAFDIEGAGAHSLELRYFPTVYRLGLILSIGGILTFAVICLGEWAIRRKLRKNRPEKEPISLPWTLSDFDEDFRAMESLPESEPKKATTVKDLLSFFKKKDKTDKDDETKNEK